MVTHLTAFHAVYSNESKERTKISCDVRMVATFPPLRECGVRVKLKANTPVPTQSASKRSQFNNIIAKFITTYEDQICTTAATTSNVHGKMKTEIQ